MIFFITFLRALAACFITNNHYSGIYPSDFLAKGGVIGNILFFAVSGYCLYNVKLPFLRWYGKRVWRIALPVLIGTAVLVALKCYEVHGLCYSWRDFFGAIIGYQNLGKETATWYFIYPTKYHFVASIVVLYVPFYFLMKITALRNRLALVMLGVGVAWFATYFLVDHSKYCVLQTREPLMRFLFMESMLLGAWFRQNDAKLRNKFSIWLPILAVVLFGGYVVFQMLVERRPALLQWQMVAPLLNLVILFLVFQSCAGLDAKLEKLPNWAKKFVTLLSDTTLEIYVVQFAIIAYFKSMKHFPLNWICTTASIILAAYVLHKACELLYGAVDKGVAKLQNSVKSENASK